MTKELNLTQRDELIEQYIDIVIDNMDTKTMIQVITDFMKDEYNDYSDDELKCQIECTHDEELYDELVDNITSEEKCQTYQELIDSNTKQYAKLPNTFGGQS